MVRGASYDITNMRTQPKPYQPPFQRDRELHSRDTSRLRWKDHLHKTYFSHGKGETSKTTFNTDQPETGFETGLKTGLETCLDGSEACGWSELIVLKKLYPLPHLAAAQLVKS